MGWEASDISAFHLTLHPDKTRAVTKFSAAVLVIIVRWLVKEQKGMEAHGHGADKGASLISPVSLFPGYRSEVSAGFTKAVRVYLAHGPVISSAGLRGWDVNQAVTHP